MMHLKMGILSFSLLFLGLVSLSQSFKRCPAEEDVYPCLCGTRRLTGNLLLECFASSEKINLEKLRKIVTSLSGKKKVELRLYKCPWSEANVTIPSDFFSGVGVQYLKLEYCKIKGLTTDNQPPLLGLEHDLEMLELEGSLMEKTVPFVLNFGHLQKLRELYIFKNQIKELGNDWINAPASLERFSMRGNRIVKVGDRAFAKLVNVREFYFADDPLPTLQRSMFPNPATKLETLYLSYNELSTLPEDIFSNMPALKSVDFEGNSLLTLDQRTWQPVWNQLSDVFLIGSYIECDNRLDWISAIGKSPEINGNCRDQVTGGQRTIMEYIKSKKQE